VYLPDEHVAAFVVIFCVVIRFYVCGSVIWALLSCSYLVHAIVINVTSKITDDDDDDDAGKMRMSLLDIIITPRGTVQCRSLKQITFMYYHYVALPTV